MRILLEVISKRYVAVLVALSEITMNDRYHATRVVKTIKGMAWVITRRFKKYSWSRKEMAGIRKWAKEAMLSRQFIGDPLQSCFEELSNNFNETLYLNLRDYTS